MPGPTANSGQPLIAPLKILALAAITLYQRFVSPRKGFSCAYRFHTGGPSCSVLGFRAVRRYGVHRSACEVASCFDAPCDGGSCWGSKRDPKRKDASMPTLSERGRLAT